MPEGKLFLQMNTHLFFRLNRGLSRILGLCGVVFIHRLSVEASDATNVQETHGFLYYRFL